MSALHSKTGRFKSRVDMFRKDDLEYDLKEGFELDVQQREGFLAQLQSNQFQSQNYWKKVVKDFWQGLDVSQKKSILRKLQGKSAFN